MGQQIGPYTIERRLALGGMAEVFLATKALGPAKKRVIVKRMLPELASDPRFHTMFLREADILAKMRHPNVVSIFDLGVTEHDELYMAMEYVDGVSLASLMKRAWSQRVAVPVELCLRAIAEAARGLDYAHRLVDAKGEPLGLIHRDVSLDNIMISREGNVKLIDFGIARGAGSEVVTKRGELKGKIMYMGPELFDGREHDWRSDLFALGVAAYWLLTGTRPFPGKGEVAVMRAVLAPGPPDPPSRKNPHLPRWVDDMVLSLLEKDPARRTQSAAEVDHCIHMNALKALDAVADAAFVSEMMREEPTATTPLAAAPRAPSVDASAPTKKTPRLVDEGKTIPRTPMPKAAALELPTDIDSGQDTVRLTESQLGIKKEPG